MTPAEIQRTTALQHAQEVRMKRAALKRRVKNGDEPLGPYLEEMEIGEPVEWLATMRVFDLLLAVPRVGDRIAIGFLRKAGMTATTSFATMTRRQQGELVKLLK